MHRRRIQQIRFFLALIYGLEKCMFLELEGALFGMLSVCCIAVNQVKMAMGVSEPTNGRPPAVRDPTAIDWAHRVVSVSNDPPATHPREGCVCLHMPTPNNNWLS